MGEMPRTRHGLIPMLVAIRVASERKRREAEAAAAASAEAAEKPKKKRGWFG
ncbi:hypothetical protein [Brevundimonas sp.]|uniref:hypothetical protein n=1 Tax=Brevundimonas sp. TaxID=1871086 RepID=UPI002D5E3AC7|nr:hypothetical protein [Brevundimonas sp.]HYC97823.1 hypothetical protein [Brevundimonas sp.]